MNSWYLRKDKHNKKQRNYYRLIALSSVKLNFNFELWLRCFLSVYHLSFFLLHALHIFSYQWKFEFLFRLFSVYNCIILKAFLFEPIQSSYMRLRALIHLNQTILLKFLELGFDCYQIFANGLNSIFDWDS